MAKKTAAELRAEAKRLLKMAEEVEKKERIEKAFRVLNAVEEYIRANPNDNFIPIEVINQARGQ
jgi:ElaB/YqjD/DUF883 family membrane-anchored ribosome-binding protein